MSNNEHSLSTFLLCGLIASSCHLTISSAQDAPGVPGDPSAAPAPAPAATFVVGRMIGMRPEEKRPLMLKESERNPYAKRSADKAATGEEGVNAEELEIRKRLSSLSVTGRSLGRNGLRVLLGDIILEQGRLLPQLLEDQSENLQVVELNENTVVLGWLDIETNELTGKTMQVSYDLSAKVGYALHGQGTMDETGEVMAPRMGVLRIEQERKRQEGKMAARNQETEIPREVYEAGQ